jgi:hypothetical protein
MVEGPECHDIKPNPSKDTAMHEGDNPSFWDEFIFKKILDGSIHIRTFKWEQKYLPAGL